MAKNKTQSAPTGLAISRNGLDFTLTWTPMKGSKRQDLKFYVKKTKLSAKDDKAKKGWTLIWGRSGQTISAMTKSKKCSLNANLYIPKTNTTVYSVVFVLKGSTKAKGEWSKEVRKEYIIAKPGLPAYYSPQKYEDHAYTYSYSWGRNAKDGNNQTVHFNSFEWQTILISSNAKSGKDIVQSEWNKCLTQKITTIDNVTGQTRTNQNSYGKGSLITIVDSASVVENNQRRFVRVRACGVRGRSDWQYCDHAFSKPRQTEIKDAEILVADVASISGTMKYEVPISNNNPVDSVELLYALAAPRTEIVTDSSGWVRTSLLLPSDYVSWTSYREVGATGKSESIAFHIDESLSEDKCLFLRVNSKHDNELRYGVPRLVLQPGGGELYSPEIGSVQMNPTNHTVSISVTNPTTLENNKSFVAVYFRTDSKTEPEKPIGIIPRGSGETSSATFKIPENLDSSHVSFGVRTLVADYSPAVYPGVLTYYDIDNVQMSSAGIVWDNGEVPMPPSKPILSKVKDGVVQVSWDWPWNAANSAELSWSDDPDAWESTNSPSTYTVDNLYSGKWKIAGLSPGTWYVRVRLIKTTEEASIFGTYSEMASINLSSAPDTPTLVLEPMVVSENETITAYWQFSSNDGSEQSYAELAEAVQIDGEWTYTPLPDASTNTASHISFSPSKYGWEDGSEHYVSLRVTAASGPSSLNWSNPVKVAIAAKPIISISGIGEANDPIHEKDIPIGIDGSDGIRTDLSLVKLPLTLSVSGAGVGGRTTVVIRRLEDFILDRPDDSTDVGYAGETVVFATNTNEDISTDFSFDTDSLVGHFDDEAQYRLIASITDSFGQTVDSDPIDFYVHWDHQAVMPEASVVFGDDDVAFISIQTPQDGYEEGDYCQIYRLSADRPQLIVSRAEIGETYVDPYPSFGIFSGYRIVYMTKYGDYRGENGDLTWVDYEPMAEEESNVIPYLSRFAIVINFENETVILPGNVSLSNSWKKEFQTTRYLGGSIEGDWKAGVERTGSYKATVPVEYDTDTMYKLRLLADYPGACHIRTPEGSNFYGNVDINDDRSEKYVNKLAAISISITKVDNVSDDGMLYREW